MAADLQHLPHQPEIGGIGLTPLFVPEQRAAEPVETSTEQTVKERPTFKIHGSVRVDGAKEHTPWTAEFPEDELAYNGLVLLLPGWGGIKRSSRGERHANAVNGIATATLDPARVSGRDPVRNIIDSQYLHVGVAEAVMFAVQDAVRSSRRVIPNASSINPDQFLLSTHSMGGFSGTDLALRHPGLVEAVIHKAAAGFGKPDVDLPGFIKEVRDYTRSGQIDPSIIMLYRIMRYYFRKPSQSVGEAITCITGNNLEKTAKLGSLGVKTAYLGFEKDTLLPPQKLYAATSEVVDAVYTMPGMGHLAPQRHPNEVSKEVAAIYTQLDTWK